MMKYRLQHGLEDLKVIHYINKKSLHWPPVIYLIDFTIILLVFKALHSLSPDYQRYI